MSQLFGSSGVEIRDKEVGAINLVLAVPKVCGKVNVRKRPKVRFAWDCSALIPLYLLFFFEVVKDGESPASCWQVRKPRLQ